MVKFSSSFFVLLSFCLVTASVVPLTQVKRDSDSPALVAREPEYPLHLAKREATGRKSRHVRPDYGAMGEKEKRDISLPDVGQVVTFPPTGIPQPIRGPWGDARISAGNEEIDRQNPDYVAPPLSDKGLFASLFILSRVLIEICRRRPQFEVVFLFVTYPPAGRWVGS